MAERLTFEGNFCEIARCRETRWGKHCPDGSCSQRKVWERLKQYEDSEAIPLVRCRECAGWDEKEHECSHWYGFRENDFCSYGERR